MKLKIIVIITIIAIILLPSTLAQFQDLESNPKVNDTNKVTHEDYKPVIFCCGKISNLHKLYFGYVSVYVFDAINVICRVCNSWPLPFFHHYSNGEKLQLATPFYSGILKENFVFLIAF